MSIAFRPWHVLAISMAIVGAPATARAIVIRHDVGDTAYRRQARKPQFAAVGKLLADDTLLGTGTLICDRWVLTSAHVVDESQAGVWRFNVGAESIRVDEIFVNPGWTGDPDDGHDLALLRLAGAAKVAPAQIFRGEDGLGTPVSILGYGYTGHGRAGVQSHDGALRTATNVVEELAVDYMLFFFDEPGSRYVTAREGMAAFNDSGGPVFIWRPDGWRVAGTHSFIRDWNENGVLADYGDIHGASRVVLHLEWLDAVLATCRGDVDVSGAVEFADILSVLSAWGGCGRCPEDFDDSGEVDIDDLVTVLTAWGPCP